MGKPMLMSWKNYAQKLEKEVGLLKSSKRHMGKYDKFLDEVVLFPNVKLLEKYLKLKARCNIELYTEVQCLAAMTPKKLDSEIISLMNQCKYIEESFEPIMELSRMYLRLESQLAEIENESR